MCYSENYTTSSGYLVLLHLFWPDLLQIRQLSYYPYLQNSGTAQGLFTELVVHVHVLFQPNIMASDEYKQGERTEQLGDSPKTEFQVRPHFE
jgi:hypothetical protein